jgi:hypothetical protein
MQVEIPGEFWQAIGFDAFFEVCETSRLDAAQCRQLWRMLDRTDEPPAELHISMKVSDLERLMRRPS